MIISDALSLWLILAGTAAGSFVTALADRHCRGQPLLYGRSCCTQCQQVIPAGDLIPLWSYARLKGKCRNCHAPIPKSVWCGEWAGLALAFLALWAGNSPAEQVCGAVFFWILLGLFQADAACFRLPNALTLPLLGAGLCLGSFGIGLAQSALAAAVGFMAFWALAFSYKRWRGTEGLGFGDVKMLAGLAAASGLTGLPWITLLAALSALLWAAFGHLKGRQMHSTMRIAFGCHLALAGGFVWLVGTAVN